MEFPIVSGPGEAFVERTPTFQQVPPSPIILIAKGTFGPSQYKYQQSPASVRSLETIPETYSTDSIAKNSSRAQYQFTQQLLFVFFGMILTGIPLAVVSTFYAQNKNCAITTTTVTMITVTSNITTTTMAVSLPGQCTSYTAINDSTRSVNAGAGALCDSALSTGWYRFVGNETLLATSAVSRDTCTTYFGGSFNGTMPSTPGTTVYGTLCLNRNGYICSNPGSGSPIGVTNCAGYYVYRLQAIPVSGCNARYCIRS